MRILVIDFSEEMRLAAIRMLRHLGHYADYVDSTSLAAQAIEKVYYDVVVIECNMPERTALWFLANARIPLGTKVIATSGFAPPGLIESMEQLGIWAYLPKPFGLKELARALEGKEVLGVAV